MTNEVWLLERQVAGETFEPYLIYRGLDDMLAANKDMDWTLVDSDVCEGTSYGVNYYATPWPVHS